MHPVDFLHLSGHFLYRRGKAIGILYSTSLRVVFTGGRSMKKPMDEKTLAREASFWKARKEAAKADIRSCRK
jgi:hypothetical protein